MALLVLAYEAELVCLPHMQDFLTPVSGTNDEEIMSLGEHNALAQMERFWEQ